MTGQRANALYITRRLLSGQQSVSGGDCGPDGSQAEWGDPARP